MPAGGSFGGSALLLRLRLRGALNRDALRRGLDRIVARHEVLRTRFELANDQPFQSIDAPDRGFELTEHDLRGAANAESRVRDLVDAEAHTPFDLNDGPMARGRLVALTAPSWSPISSCRKRLEDRFWR